MRFADLETPALLLDLDRLERNLSAMAARCARLGVALRPHAKTHKCLEIAERQRALGACGLTVSTLDEARVFAAHGFDDLTWAFPLPPGRAAAAAELAALVTFRVLVDSPEAVVELARHGRPPSVWLEVDSGQGRSGVDPRGTAAQRVVEALAGAGHVRFDGLLTHAGQAYHVRGSEALAQIAEQERRTVVELAARLRAAGCAVPGVSVGSTPGMSAVRDLDGVTEARPGNYALYDRTQVVLGSCTAADCAASILASVVSAQPGSRHSVVDAGALALSQDPGPDPGAAHFGGLYLDASTERLDPDHRVVALTQEHGVIDRRMARGDRVRILPNHSCLAVAQFDRFHVVRGDRLVDVWAIHRTRGIALGDPPPHSSM